MTAHIRQFGVQLAAMVLGIVVSLLIFVGCSSSNDAVNATGVGPDSTEREKINAAQSDLFEHDISAASDGFNSVLAERPTSGEAAAGAAITELLLLPYSSSVTGVLRELGASRGLDKKTDLVYSDGGLLYLMSRGVPFEDGASFPGIKTLLIDDLPWTSRQFDSVEEFVRGLDQPLNGAIDALVSVADDMAPIQAKLETAVEDPEFKTFFVPGEVFHDQDLSLVMSKTELLGLQMLISAVRGGVYFVSAYAWDFSLEDALGDRWSNVTSADTEFVDGYDYDDYVIAYLDSRVFRAIRDTSPLSKAKAQFSDAIGGLVAMLRSGKDAQYQGELDFAAADEDYISEAIEFLGAVDGALSASTSLPYVVPASSMDISVFFGSGRVLAAEISWFVREEIQDEFGSFFEWNLTAEAQSAVFIQGVFDPEFAPDSGPDVEMSGTADSLTESLAGALQEDVEDAYFSGR